MLIALGAESLIERWHWHEQTEQTREAIKGELGYSALYSWERFIVSRCLKVRLRDLLVQLNAGHVEWKGSPMEIRETQGEATILPVYRSPSRLYLDDAWKNALAGGVFNHMPGAEVDAHSPLFREVAKLDEIQEAEAAAASKLAPLSFDQEIDECAKLEMTSAIAEVDRNRRAMEVVGKDLLDQIGRLHLHFERADIQKRRTVLLSDQRSARGNCVRSIPLEMN